MRLALFSCATTAVLLMVSGCSIFPASEPPRTLGLAPGVDAITFPQALPASLRVNRPLASDPFDTSRILIKPSAYEFRALASARWRDSLPVIVRDQLIASLRASGGFANVVTDTSPANTDHQLVTELYGFHVETTGQNDIRVIIALHADVIDNRTRVSRCAKGYRIERTADTTDTDTLMAAFGSATQALNHDIVTWSYQCLKSRTP